MSHLATESRNSPKADSSQQVAQCATASRNETASVYGNAKEPHVPQPPAGGFAQHSRLLPAGREREPLAPLSFAQEQVWLVEQLHTAAVTCNLQLSVRLNGVLSIPVLERSLQELVGRHAILRSRILLVSGKPMLEATAESRLPLIVRDLLTGSEQELALLLDQEMRASFDLAHGPLLRTSLYRMSATEHILQVVAHQAAADTASMAILLADLAAIYTAYAQGLPSPLVELPIQYGEYALQERADAREARFEASLAYWRRQLAGVPPLSLPTDHPQPPVQSTQAALVQDTPPPELLLSLTRLGEAEGGSLFVVLLAAFEVLLHRYSGQEDFAVGAIVANRPPGPLQQMIGPFAHALPVRVDLSGRPTFRQFLRCVCATLAEARTHQHVRFEQIVAEFQNSRDPEQAQVLQVMCSDEAPLWSDIQFHGLAWEQVAVDSRCALTDLALDLAEVTQRGVWGLVYNTDLFERSTAARMLAQFRVLLAALAANPDVEVARLPILPDAERNQVLVDWNFTEQDLPRQLCIHELVESQVEQTPDAVAVIHGDQELTYRQLNERANQLAHHLLALGAGPETLVGVYVERSPAMIVALLGVLKAGAAYLPLDPAYPGDRLRFMLADAQLELLLTQNKLLPDLAGFAGRTLCLDSDWPEIARASVQNPEIHGAPGNLAYVIYTSGSTGQPKGVQIEHGALVNYVAAASQAFGLGPDDRMLQFASISFDAAAEEIYCPLVRGATLVLRTDAMLDSVSAFLQACRDLQITILDLPTAYWHTLTVQMAQGDAALPENLRLVIIGGERVLPEPVQVWRRFASPLIRLVNTYGPTEATVVATMCDLAGPQQPDHSSLLVPIGRPVANVQIYLLDAELQPVPIGIPGEIYIGGAGLARGYLNRPELTAQKFIPNPFAAARGQRLYKTGDLGRYLPDGRIDYVGRRDDQVKVRGFRVELREIEAVLNEHPAVGHGVIKAWDDGAGSTQLAAYVVAAPDTTPVIADLRDYVASRLPNYMTPAAFVVLDTLPLTSNGKVDRKRLPHPGDSAGRSMPYAPPRTALELQLTQIWEEVLGVPLVGVNDDFFALGGHSLAAARLFVLIESWLGRSLPLATLFQAPTVAELAAVMQDDQWTPPWSSLVPIQPLGSKPPFFCVHGFGGDVVGYRDLAQLLGPDQPFYGFQARGLNDLDEPHTDIATMAADYIRFMRRLQPKGPYYLGGYCYGGVVAFEMARQLADAGERTNLVAVLEGYAVERKEVQRELWRPQVLASFAQNLPFWLRDQLHPDGPFGDVLPWGRLKRTAQPASNGARQKPDAATDFAMRRRRLEQAHDWAMDRYQPGPYIGRVALFRVQAMSLFRSHDPTMGWGRLAEQGVDVHMIAGAHYNILEQPHVADLAAQLLASLEAAQAG